MVDDSNCVISWLREFYSTMNNIQIPFASLSRVFRRPAKRQQLNFDVVEFERWRRWRTASQKRRQNDKCHHHHCHRLWIHFDGNSATTTRLTQAIIIIFFHGKFSMNEASVCLCVLEQTQWPTRAFRCRIINWTTSFDCFSTVRHICRSSFIVNRVFRFLFFFAWISTDKTNWSFVCLRHPQPVPHFDHLFCLLFIRKLFVQTETEKKLKPIFLLRNKQNFQFQFSSLLCHIERMEKCIKNERRRNGKFEMFLFIFTSSHFCLSPLELKKTKGDTSLTNEKYERNDRREEEVAKDKINDSMWRRQERKWKATKQSKITEKCLVTSKRDERMCQLTFVRFVCRFLFNFRLSAFRFVVVTASLLFDFVSFACDDLSHRHEQSRKNIDSDSA